MFASIKGYFYGIGVAAILAVLGWVYYHGEKHVETKDKQVAAAAQVQVRAAQTTAQSTETHNVLIYKQAVSVPLVGDLGVVCHAPRSGSLPAATSRTVTRAGEQPTDSGTGSAFDPTGPALDLAAKTDAQIAYLQGRVHELETEMTKAHRR